MRLPDSLVRVLASLHFLSAALPILSLHFYERWMAVSGNLTSIARYAERSLTAARKPPTRKNGKFVFNDPYKILVVIPDGCTLVSRSAGQAKGMDELEMTYLANGYSTTSGGGAIAIQLLGGMADIGKIVFTKHLQDPNFISLNSPSRWANLEFLQQHPFVYDWRNAAMRTIALSTIAAMKTSSATVEATRFFTKYLPSGKKLSDMAEANLEAMTRRIEEVAGLYKYPVNPAYLIDHVYEQDGLRPNYRKVETCGVDLTIMVTDVETGRKVPIKNPEGIHKIKSGVKASMHFVLAGPPTETYQGRTAWEGAYSGPIYDWAISEGYTDVVVLECKDAKDFTEHDPWYQKLKDSAVRRFAPDAAKAYTESEKREVEAHDQIMSSGVYKNKEGNKINVAIIRVAPSTPSMRKTEVRPEKLGPQYDAGRASFLDAMRPHHAGRTAYERAVRDLKSVPAVV
jgi:hypothetical protein